MYIHVIVNSLPTVTPVWSAPLGVDELTMRD
jgi:hypothetical protein